MKKMKVVGLVIGLIGIFGVGNVVAADVVVNAEVLATCSVTGTTITLPNLDPTSGAPESASGSINVTCTNGVPWTLTDDAAGVYQLTGPGTIDYSMTYGKTSDTGSGSAQPVSITVDVVFNDYFDQPAGIYNDTVVVSVNP